MCQNEIVGCDMSLFPCFVGRNLDVALMFSGAKTTRLNGPFGSFEVGLNDTGQCLRGIVMAVGPIEPSVIE